MTSDPKRDILSAMLMDHFAALLSLEAEKLKVKLDRLGESFLKLKLDLDEISKKYKEKI